MDLLILHFQFVIITCWRDLGTLTPNLEIFIGFSQSLQSWCAWTCSVMKVFLNINLLIAYASIKIEVSPSLKFEFKLEQIYFMCWAFLEICLQKRAFFLPITWTFELQYYLEKNLEARARELEREAELEEKSPKAKAKSKMSKVMQRTSRSTATSIHLYKPILLKYLSYLFLTNRPRRKLGRSRKCSHFKLRNKSQKDWRMLKDGIE